MRHQKLKAVPVFHNGDDDGDCGGDDIGAVEEDGQVAEAAVVGGVDEIAVLDPEIQRSG